MIWWDGDKSSCNTWLLQLRDGAVISKGREKQKRSVNDDMNVQVLAGMLVTRNKQRDS